MENIEENKNFIVILKIHNINKIKIRIRKLNKMNYCNQIVGNSYYNECILQSKFNIWKISCKNIYKQ